MEVLLDTYKDTKIGRIPQDWEVLKFREIFDFIITSSHSKNEMVYSDTDTEIYNVHYGAIHTTYKEQILDFEKYNVPRITDDSKLPREDQFLKDGDLVIVDASEDWGGMGECVELKNIGSKKVIGGLHTFAVRDKINAFVKGFTGYIFQNTAVRNKLASFANVSKVYGITKGNISNVPIVIPPLPEQQKIAAILSTVDEQISTTDKIIEKSKELKKGLMQKLFSEGIGHTEFKDTKIGRIPKDWEFNQLGELCEVITKGTTPTTNGFPYLKTGINFVKVESINAFGRFIKEKFAFIGEDCYKSFKRSQLKEGDILISIAGALGRTAIVTDNILPANTNQAVGILRLKDKSLKNFIRYFLDSYSLQKFIKRINVASAQANLNLGHLNKFNIPFPAINEQQKIVAILSEADAKIEKEQTQKAQLQALKKGLMQELKKKKKRVKV